MDPKKGGRLTREQIRERRINAVLKRVDDADLIRAEALLSVLEDPSSSHAVRVQASLGLEQIQERLRVRGAPAQLTVRLGKAAVPVEELLETHKQWLAVFCHEGEAIFESLPSEDRADFKHIPIEHLHARALEYAAKARELLAAKAEGERLTREVSALRARLEAAELRDLVPVAEQRIRREDADGDSPPEEG